jgi:hypothetical protein
MRVLGAALLTVGGALAVLASAAVAKPPVVVIDAPRGIVDDPKRDATMRVFDSWRREDYSGPIGIELRGAGSHEFPKKAYGVEIRSRSGEHRNVSLLGMPREDDWALVANWLDESLLRNYVAYSTSRWLGWYAPRTRLVEVILNDRYEGVYLLAETLKLHESRVAVDDTDVSGGYLLQMVFEDRTEGHEFFSTAVNDQAIIYEDPNREDLSYGSANWIRDYVNRFERTLYGDRFRDRRRGYRRYLDMDAAVDYVLLNELFKNADTFWASTYMHMGTGGKLVLGPLWDFDHAFGNRQRDPWFNTVKRWTYKTRHRFWWVEQLYADPAFRRRMVERWRDLRKRGIERHILETIDRGTRQLVGGPQERNFSRWPVFGTDEVQPEDPRTGAPPANYAQAVDYLRWWVVERCRWITKHIKSLKP